MLNLLLCAALAQVPDGPMQSPSAGLPPLQGLAVIDAKGTLTIKRVSPVCGYGLGDQELWLKAPEKKDGDKVQVKAKVTRLMVTVIELPANVVEAHTVDG